MRVPSPRDLPGTAERLADRRPGESIEPSGAHRVELSVLGRDPNRTGEREDLARAATLREKRRDDVIGAPLSVYGRQQVSTLLHPSDECA